jgi:hypothetical protein
MATTVWGAAGTTLSIDEIVGNSNTFSLINNITDLDGLFGGTVVAAVTTSLATVNSHTFRGTIRKPDEVSGTLWYDPTDAVHKFVRNWNNYPGNGAYTIQVIFNTGNTTSTGTALAAACTSFSPISGDTTWVNSV